MTLFCGFDLELPQPFKDIAFNELPLWKKYYLPVDVKGLTVLDVGAGVGETAAFYLSQGAKKVVCVQPDYDPSLGHPVSYLYRNAERMGNVEVVADYFKPEHMGIAHGLLKMDCEGCERLLYHWSLPLMPCVIEAHSDEIADRLVGRFQLKRVYPVSLDHYGVWILHPLDSPLPEFVRPPGSMAAEKDAAEYLKSFLPV